MRGLAFLYYLHFVYALLLIISIVAFGPVFIVPLLWAGFVVYVLEGCMQLNGDKTILTPLFGEAKPDRK